MIIKGYAARFNEPSEDLGGFKEYIDPHAFDKALSGRPDVVILYNHDPNLVLGRTGAGTASVETDSKGVFFTCSFLVV